MKIYVNNKVYISNHDIEFLLKKKIHMPDSVKYELDKELVRKLDNEKVEDEHDFIEFTSNEAKEFFNNLGFIINYDDVKNMNIKELKDEKREIQNEYKNKSETDFKKLNADNPEIMAMYNLEIDELNQSIKSLDEIIEYKKGKLNIDIPKKYSKKELERRNALIYFLASGHNTDIFNGKIQSVALRYDEYYEDDGEIGDDKTYKK